MEEAEFEMIGLLQKLTGLGLVCCMMGSTTIQEEGHQMMSKARWAATAFDMKNICTLLECDYALDGRYPEDFKAWISERFCASVTGKKVTEDHWGHAYFYEVQGDRVILISKGEDGHLDTRDDLVFIK